MRMHGHGNADGAQNHGHQADEAEDGSRVFKALAERGIAFAEIHDLRVGQGLFDVFAQLHRVDLCGQFHQQALAGAASGNDEAGLLESRLRNHHARANAGTSGQPVWLLPENRGNGEVLAAQTQCLTDFGV